MNLEYSQEERNFRDEARTWLREHIPKEPRPHGGPAMREFDTEWQRTQWEAGWAGIAWPREYGGCGLSVIEQLIWYEEYAKAEAPPAGVNFVGLNHAGPTLMARGNDEQRETHLPAILRGESVWCQGFSEPNAGSDLASVSTRAVLDGDEMIVNGQKIWTSYADSANFQELLVRTNPGASKHRGITWMICPMDAAGIDVRPIQAISGTSHFCEVFYDDVRIPVSNVVGEVDDGWNVAMSTLSFERGTAFMAEQVELSRKVERLMDLARTRKDPSGRRRAIDDDEMGRRLGRARAEVAALRSMTYAMVSRVQRTETPGPEASIVRLYYSLLWQRVAQIGVDLIGPSLIAMEQGSDEADLGTEYLDSLRATISAGTKDIQRNIIGERVLGLPRGR